MCEVFEVSRSGYYAWRKRQGKEAKDQWLVDLIVQCQELCKQTYGIRRVRRWIQRQAGKTVNLKAILRIMRKLSLLSVVRRRRPYTRYQQAVHKYPNLLNRCFDQTKPNQFWVTDITYIPIPGSMDSCSTSSPSCPLIYSISEQASAETAVSTAAELVSVVCVTAEEEAKLAGSMP